MIYRNTFYLLLMVIKFDLSSTCPISSSFNGLWIQPGLTDLITINNTWFSSKGICLHGQQDMKNKYIYYNEQTRCKRCILFVLRHPNTLQYRESECFDGDDEDDNSRICASITPDTVLYTLFRDNAQSIPCPFDQSWHFKRDYQICQPKAFHHCSAMDTFQITYNNRCPTNQDVIAKCIAHFSDGNMNYVISRNMNQEKFLCFSYTKQKNDHRKNSLPNEVYFSEDETCRDLLTRESTRILNILPSQSIGSQKYILPDWTQGTWLSIETNTVYINKTELQMKINQNVKSLQIVKIRQIHEYSLRIRAKSLEQCSSKFYCIKLIYRSPAVIDLSIGSDEHHPQDYSKHYTLFKPMMTSDISCPQNGVYKSLNTYRSPLPITTCSIGQWSLSIGCDAINQSELVLSSSCRHEYVPDVQVLTSIKGLCLASWQSDDRFQRTIVIYEKTKAFCLIQPLKSSIASWILSESSCTNIDVSSITVGNSFQYADTCLTLPLSSSTSSSMTLSYLLFYLTMQVIIYM